MALLNDIAGKRQEVLASEVLRYLLAGSHELRAELLDVLASYFGPLGSGAHFASYLELPTTSDNWGDGRLDLLIETDEALVGFEIKIWAGFQAGQPEKYVQTLVERADKLRSFRSVPDYAAFLVVLAPESRRKEMETSIEKKSKESAFEGLIVPCQFLPWEELFQRFNELDQVAPQIRFLASELRTYIAEIVGALSNFSQMAKFLNRWVPNGSRWQREVVGGLWHYVPNPGSRLSATPKWCGYYLGDSPERSPLGWYGFVRQDQILDPSDRNEAELVFALDQSIPEWEESRFAERAKLVSPEWGSDKVYVINFEPQWTEANWREVLEPLHLLAARAEE